MWTSGSNFHMSMKFLLCIVALWINEGKALVLSSSKNFVETKIRFYHSGQQWKSRMYHVTDKLESKETKLFMHIGHSHSHDHHHRTEDSHKLTGSASNTDLRVWPRRRRLFALILFCAGAILGPPFARSQKLENKDVAAFLVTAISLFLMEPLRAQVQYLLLRIRQLGDGISRHSGPISARYIFKNENAADRVTLLG
jgi:hypothetical protein